jgi:hypothetical protein
VPTSSDLVKDGATAIEALGDAIDATVFALPSGALTKISTTTFTGVTSVSLPTSTFTSTYKNYRILFNLSAASAGGTITARLRAAGTDAIINYAQMTTGLTDAGSASNRSQSSQTSWTLEGTNTSAFFEMSLDIFDPQVATNTTATGGLICDNGSTYVGKSLGLLHATSSAYDSMSFIISNGTFGGTIVVMGYSV